MLVMLNVVKLNVVILNAIMLIVVAIFATAVSYECKLDTNCFLAVTLASMNFYQNFKGSTCRPLVVITNIRL
jgi:hypothetical protein